MTAAASQSRSARRVAASPYARRLARERGFSLTQLRGSGPGGRIVAADLAGVAQTAVSPPAPQLALRFSALAATIQLSTMLKLLADFSATATAFTLDDVALRAIGCALDDVPGVAQLAGAPVALEADGRQLLFSDIRKGSLGPLHSRRLAALDEGEDLSSAPAELSLRLLPAGDIRPVLMPLLPGRNLRLVLAVGEASAEALLSFDAGTVSEDAAAALLGRFKVYLEQPLRLLA